MQMAGKEGMRLSRPDNVHLGMSRNIMLYKLYFPRSKIMG